MPETRLERTLFALGLVAIALLGVIIARSWHRQSSPHASPTAATVTAASTPTTSLPTHPVATTHAATTTRAPTNTTAATTTAATVSLVLSAPRGASWMQVRNGSAKGTTLYDGTLTQGTSKSFHASVIWVRFGLAGNIDATVNGSTTRLPRGTYSARFDQSGYHYVSG